MNVFDGQSKPIGKHGLPGFKASGSQNPTRLMPAKTVRGPQDQTQLLPKQQHAKVCIQTHVFKVHIDFSFLLLASLPTEQQYSCPYTSTPTWYTPTTSLAQCDSHRGIVLGSCCSLRTGLEPGARCVQPTLAWDKLTHPLLPFQGIKRRL